MKWSTEFSPPPVSRSYSSIASDSNSIQGPCGCTSSHSFKSALATRREFLSRSQFTRAWVSRRCQMPEKSSFAICTGMSSSSHRLRTGSRYLQSRAMTAQFDQFQSGARLANRFSSAMTVWA